MTKEDFKKAVLVGVVTGITIAITLFTLILGYLEAEKQYKEYKHRQESVNKKFYGVIKHSTYFINSINMD